MFGRLIPDNQLYMAQLETKNKQNKAEAEKLRKQVEKLEVQVKQLEDEKQYMEYQLQSMNDINRILSKTHLASKAVTRWQVTTRFKSQLEEMKEQRDLIQKKLEDCQKSQTKLAENLQLQQQSLIDQQQQFQKEKEQLLKELAKTSGLLEQHQINSQKLHKDKANSDAQLEFAIEQAAKFQQALQIHTEARTGLILSVQTALAHFVSNIQNIYSSYWPNLGQFVGYADNGKLQGILLQEKPGLSAITIGTWDFDGTLFDLGIKLQSNNVAFCGNFVQGRYSGENNIYMGTDESVQIGQMSDGFFNGNSVKSTKEGKTIEGKWVRDRLQENISSI